MDGFSTKDNFSLFKLVELLHNLSMYLHGSAKDPCGTSTPDRIMSLLSHLFDKVVFFHFPVESISLNCCPIPVSFITNEKLTDWADRLKKVSSVQGCPLHQVEEVNDGWSFLVIRYCSTANFPIVGLIQDHLISFQTLKHLPRSILGRVPYE